MELKTDMYIQREPRAPSAGGRHRLLHLDGVVHRLLSRHLLDHVHDVARQWRRCSAHAGREILALDVEVLKAREELRETATWWHLHATNELQASESVEQGA